MAKKNHTQQGHFANHLLPMKEFQLIPQFRVMRINFLIH